MPLGGVLPQRRYDATGTQRKGITQRHCARHSGRPRNEDYPESHQCCWAGFYRNDATRRYARHSGRWEAPRPRPGVSPMLPGAVLLQRRYDATGTQRKGITQRHCARHSGRPRNEDYPESHQCCRAGFYCNDATTQRERNGKAQHNGATRVTPGDGRLRDRDLVSQQCCRAGFHRNDATTQRERNGKAQHNGATRVTSEGQGTRTAGRVLPQRRYDAMGAQREGAQPSPTLPR